MLKRIYVLFLVSLLTKYSYAQSTFGIQAGGNLGYQKIELTNSSSYSSKSFIGYFVGLTYKARLNNKFSFAPEVNFTLIGSRNKYLVTDSAFNPREQYFNNKAGYLELSLLLQYNLGKASLVAGPALLVNLFTRTASLDVGPPYKPTDWSANIGAGYRITDRWDVGLRYSHGLTDINDDSSIKAEWRNRHVRLGLRYNF